MPNPQFNDTCVMDSTAEIHKMSQANPTPKRLRADSQCLEEEDVTEVEDVKNVEKEAEKSQVLTEENVLNQTPLQIKSANVPDGPKKPVCDNKEAMNVDLEPVVLDLTKPETPEEKPTETASEASEKPTEATQKPTEATQRPTEANEKPTDASESDAKKQETSKLSEASDPPLEATQELELSQVQGESEVVVFVSARDYLI